MQARLQRVASDAPQDATNAAQAAGALLSDPAKALGLVQQEAANALSRTPEGLEMLAFTVLERREGYELRRYESYSAVVVPLTGGSALEVETYARGYNTLGSYMFGANGDGAVWISPKPTSP